MEYIARYNYPGILDGILQSVGVLDQPHCLKLGNPLPNNIPADLCFSLVWLSRRFLSLCSCFNSKLTSITSHVCVHAGMCMCMYMYTRGGGGIGRRDGAYLYRQCYLR